MLLSLRVQRAAQSPPHSVSCMAHHNHICPLVHTGYSDSIQVLGEPSTRALPSWQHFQ